MNLESMIIIDLEENHHPHLRKAFFNPPAIAVLEEGVDLSSWNIVAASWLLLTATRMPVA